jgi:hypothetical protein
MIELPGKVSDVAHNPIGNEMLQSDPLTVGRLLLEQALLKGDFTKSLIHAHEPDLHSIMLHDFGDDGGKIRMFFAPGNAHHLYARVDDQNDLRCRMHDHRFNLAVVPLLGEVLQIHMEETPQQRASQHLHKYQFGSAIRGALKGMFTFTPLGEVGMSSENDELLRPGEASLMNSDELHSVNTTPEGRNSDVAWLVIEGTEQKNSSVLYSVLPDLPAEEPAQGLYTPITPGTSVNIVRHVLRTMPKK